MSSHEGPCHDVKVAEHLIALLPLNAPNGICVNLAKEQGHCATGPQGSRRNVLPSEPKFVAHDIDFRAEGDGELSAAD